MHCAPKPCLLTKLQQLTTQRLHSEVLLHIEVAADLETVHCQPPAGLLIAILQITYDAVVHILFLLSQEMGRDSIQRITAQLVVTLNGLEQVKLNATVYGDLLVLVCAIGFAAE